ncbi:MAG TPA: Wzz/FepE/Etk N-terminal domain-containing protein, partial [Longimicrobium sp.]|nr:Wzz/FepE/Etk N-terminal domain-containing protein [Longimicrobium sp.]
MVDHRTEALPGDREELNIADLWNTLVRNRWLVLGVTVAVVGLAALYTARKRPVYQSTATLAVDDDKANRNPLSDLVPFSGGSQGKLETDMVVLRSRSVAEEVVDSLHLTVRVVEPNLPRDQVLRTIRVPRDAPVGVYALERDGRAYTLRAEKRPPKAAPVRLPARVEAGVPFRVGGAELALAPALARPGAPDRVVFAIAPFRAAVSGMQTALVVSRADPKAKVLAVSYTTTDPVQAALVPNVLSQRFIDYKAALAKAESRNTVDFLRGQVAAYQRDLLGAENALRGFRESQRVVSPQEEAVQQVQRLATLQAERDRLRSEREALSKLLDRVSQGHREGQSSEYRQLASFPVFLSNKAVQDYLQSLTALENER